MKIVAFISCITGIMAQSFNRANFPAFGETRVNSAWTAIALNGQIMPSSGADVVGCNDPNDWALTYDDGPGPNTDGVLTALRDRGVKATFFVVGQQVVENPDLLRKAYNDGHEIALHTWTHSSLPTLSNDQIVAEVVWTAKAVRDIIGVVPNVIRPPYGNIDSRVRSVLQSLGLKIIIWNVDTNDWTYAGRPIGEAVSGITSVINNCIAGCADKSPNQGGILLEHDYPNAFAIPNVLDIMKSSKYTLKTISQCVGIGAYSSNWLDRIEGGSILPPNPSTTTSTSTTTAFILTSTSTTTSTITTSESTTTSTITTSESTTSTTSSTKDSIMPSTELNIDETPSESHSGTTSPGSSPSSTQMEKSQPALNASFGSSDGFSAIGTFLLVVFTIFLYV